MLIDKARFEQALTAEQQRPYFSLFAGLSAYSDYDDLDLAALRAHLTALPAEFDVHDLLALADPEQHFSPEWPKRMVLLVKLAVGAAVAGWVPQPLHVTGDWHLTGEDDAATYVFGDLTVTGSLQLARPAPLIVLGNVTVGQAWMGGLLYNDNAVIAGNLTVGRSLLSQGMLAVGGCLQTPYVFLDFNVGYTTVLGGCRAHLLLEADHIGSWIFGDTQVDYLDTSELRFEHEPTGSGGFEAMLDRLPPEVAAAFAPDEVYEHDDLLEVIRQSFRTANDQVLRPVPGWPAA